MANDIFFGTGELDDLKIGTSQVDKVYLGDTLVWPIVVASGVDTVSIDNAGFIKVAATTYACTQRSTTGSGTGFTCTATINGSFNCTAITITNKGTGYAVNDEITLDFTSVDESREITYVVLEVLTLS
jgi:hypothetical protein